MAYGSWHGAEWKNVWSNGYYSIDLQWDYCQDIENNKTKISLMALRVTGLKARYSFYNVGAKAGLGDFTGNKYESTVNANVAILSSQTFDLTDRHTEIPHDADGSWKNGTYCGWWEFKAGINGTYHAPEVGWTAFRVDGLIPKIPRATTPTFSFSSVTMGSAVTINLPKATSSFTHDIFYKYSGDSNYTTMVSDTTVTSYSWTPPVSLANKIPNVSAGTWTILVRTKSGSTVIGDKTVNITLNVPDSVQPVISSVSIAEATPGLAAKFGAYIQTKSALKVTVSASGASGSSIKSYAISVDGRSYSGSSNTITTQVINKSGTLSIVTTVTDSRGRTASKTVTVNVLAYAPPSISSFRIVRCNSDGTVNESGTAIKITYSFSMASLNSKNNKSFKIQQSNGSSWSDIETITASYSGSTSVIKTGPFSVDTYFNFRAVATDYFSEASVYTDIRPSFSLINFGAGGKSIAFGTVSANDGTVQCALPLGHAHRTSVSGSDGGYLKILTLKVLNRAWNYGAIEFKYFSGAMKGKFPIGKIIIIGGNTTDPSPELCTTTDPDFPFWIHKSATNTWDVYVQRAGSEQAAVFDVVQYLPSWISWSFANVNVASLPSGSRRAQWEYLDACYPTGSIISSSSATNPGNRLGGTWSQIAQGRMLIGAGSLTDANGVAWTITSGQTGGTYNHNHLYGIQYSHVNGASHIRNLHQSDIMGHYSWKDPSKVQSNFSDTGCNSGGQRSDTTVWAIYANTSPSDNAPPFYGVYFWKRTA